jgi:23S rRNA (guanosine2251-2'-O)-methyltransferase
MTTHRLEGRTSILAALEAGKRTFEAVLLSRSAHKSELLDLFDAAERRGVPIKEVEEAELEAHGKSHGGVVAVVGPKPLATAEELYALIEALKVPAFVALFEGADDARNLGYLMRTAEAFGVHAVLVRRRAWDVDETALSRSSSGSYERLPVVLVDRDLRAIGELKRRRLKLVGAIPRARDPIYKVDMKVPLILAIGGEKRGLSGAVREECDRLTCIPTAGGPTSLAMTQAGAIVLSEVARQRGLDRAAPAA